MELLSMLLGVFKVQETRVKDIMIPRSSMVIIKKNSSLDDILPLIIDSSHSRFPVILENKDEIVGILLAKDLLKYLAKKNGNFDIEKVIKQYDRKYPNFKFIGTTFIDFDTKLQDSCVEPLLCDFDLQSYVGNKNKLLDLVSTKTDFIYYKRNGKLFFNENQSQPGFGDGGVIAKFYDKPKLDQDR